MKLFYYTILLIALTVLSGCASSTIIFTEPQGAAITVDNEYIGESPVRYTDTAVIFTTRQVVAEMPGYLTLDGTFKRSGDLNVGAFIGGLCFWPILLWALDYPATVTYRLEPSDSQRPRHFDEWSVVYP